MGPMVSRLGASGQTPSRGIRPYVVLRPTVPQHADGIRIDPPVSDPMATSASSVATATGAPPEEATGLSAAARSVELRDVGRRHHARHLARRVDGGGRIAGHPFWLSGRRV